nr:Chain B, Latrophilin-1 [Rattus norvegicus]
TNFAVLMAHREIYHHHHH